MQPSDVPMEKTSRTQPFPTKSPVYGRPWLRVPDDLIDFTPAMRAQALENLKNYRVAGMYNPPLLGKAIGWVARRDQCRQRERRRNEPAGAGADPETHTVYAQAAMAFVSGLSLRDMLSTFASDMKYVSGVEGTEFREALGPGFGSAADSPLAGRGRAGAAPGQAAAAGAARSGGRGHATCAVAAACRLKGCRSSNHLYGVLAAIDLDKGELKFQVPHGDTPDNVRTNPSLQGMNIPKTGQNGSVGLMVTKTVVVLGDPQVTSPPGRPRGAMLRAYGTTARKSARSACWPGAERLADDLHGRRQAVYRRGRKRRHLLR